MNVDHVDKIERAFSVRILIGAQGDRRSLPTCPRIPRWSRRRPDRLASRPPHRIASFRNRCPSGPPSRPRWPSGWGSDSVRSTFRSTSPGPAPSVCRSSAARRRDVSGCRSVPPFGNRIRRTTRDPWAETTAACFRPLRRRRAGPLGCQEHVGQHAEAGIVIRLEDLIEIHVPGRDLAGERVPMRLGRDERPFAVLEAHKPMPSSRSFGARSACAAFRAIRESRAISSGCSCSWQKTWRYDSSREPSRSTDKPSR